MALFSYVEDTLSLDITEGAALMVAKHVFFEPLKEKNTYLIILLWHYKYNINLYRQYTETNRNRASR